MPPPTNDLVADSADTCIDQHDAVGGSHEEPAHLKDEHAVVVEEIGVARPRIVHARPDEHVVRLEPCRPVENGDDRDGADGRDGGRRQSELIGRWRPARGGVANHFGGGPGQRAECVVEGVRVLVGEQVLGRGRPPLAAGEVVLGQVLPRVGQYRLEGSAFERPRRRRHPGHRGGAARLGAVRVPWRTSRPHFESRIFWPFVLRRRAFSLRAFA